MRKLRLLVINFDVSGRTLIATILRLGNLAGINFSNLIVLFLLGANGIIFSDFRSNLECFSSEILATTIITTILLTNHAKRLTGQRFELVNQVENSTC